MSINEMIDCAEKELEETFSAIEERSNSEGGAPRSITAINLRSLLTKLNQRWVVGCRRWAVSLRTRFLSIPQKKKHADVQAIRSSMFIILAALLFVKEKEDSIGTFLYIFKMVDSPYSHTQTL